MRKPINPALLKQLRREKKMSQQELARRAGLSKGSVHRLEAGRQPGSRQRTLRGLARALGVAAGVLTGDLPAPADASAPRAELPESQMNFRVDDRVRNAFWLASIAYAVPMARLIELAPYLFVCAAEASLARRRARLAELAALFDRQHALADSFPHLPLGIRAHSAADDAIEAERKSIAASDILAGKLRASLGDHSEPSAARSSVDGRRDPAACNPFVLFLRESEPANKDLASISRFDDCDAACTVRRDIALRLCGGDAELAESIVAGATPLYRMPVGLLGEEAAAARAAWLREHCAEYRARRDPSTNDRTSGSIAPSTRAV